MPIVRKYQTIGFSVPPAMARRIAALVKARQSTRSEFFREMFRVWEQQQARQTRQDRDSDQAILRLAAAVRAAERARPTPQRDTQRFFAALGRDLRQRARRLGLTITEDGEISEIGDPAHP